MMAWLFCRFCYCFGCNASGILLLHGGMVKKDVTGDLADKAGKFKINTRPVLKLTGDEYLQEIHFNDGTVNIA